MSVRRFATALGVALAVCGSTAGCARGPAPNADVARHMLPDSAAVMALLAGTQNAACPLPGVATGGQPDSARFEAMSTGGVRTVIDQTTP